jgi:hypothetical protein
MVALFAVDDRHHQRIEGGVASLARTGLRLLSTWPCVVEAAYLLDKPHRFEMLKWIELGGVQLYPFEAQDLGAIVTWMEQYSERNKRDMDLADASLYWLATETGVTEVLTIDIADFRRYRLPDGKAFTLL